MATDKSPSPAYASFKSLGTYFDQRREDGHITDVVDKTLMNNFSGSTQNELLIAFKFLKLINEKNQPTELYKNYVAADEDGRKKLMADIIAKSYPFLYSTDGFNLERGTTGQMQDVFRTQGLNGSTLARAIAFFLSAAKYAGIKVSPNIKAPAAQRPRSKKEPKPNGGARGAEDDLQDDDDDHDPAGSQVFYIPIPIDRRVKIVIPAVWGPADWDRFTRMLELYVEGWKELAQHKTTNKDKGPTPEKE